MKCLLDLKKALEVEKLEDQQLGLVGQFTDTAS